MPILLSKLNVALLNIPLFMYINVFLCIFYSLSYFYGYIAFIYKKKCLTQTFCFYLCSEPMSSALHLVLLWQFLIKIIYAYILVSCTLGNVTLELVQLLFHCFEIDTVSDFISPGHNILCALRSNEFLIACFLFDFIPFFCYKLKFFCILGKAPVYTKFLLGLFPPSCFLINL